MKKNVGKVDKIVRILLAIVLIALYYFQVVTGTLGVVMLVVSGALVITSLFSFCALYTLCGVNTCPIKNNDAQN